jgi:cytochrome c oxidase subunit 3
MGTAIAAAGHHADEHIDNDRKLRFGMLFYVVTDVILSIFLTSAYPFLHTVDNVQGWFPFHFTLDFTSGNIVTGLLVVSGILFFVAQRALKANNQMLFKGSIVVSVALMIVSLIMQVNVSHNFVFAAQDGSFASTWIVLSGYHIYHLVLGTFLGLGVANRALQGRYTSSGTVGLQAIGYYWYWVAIYSIALTLLPIVLPPAI